MDDGGPAVSEGAEVLAKAAFSLADLYLSKSPAWPWRYPPVWIRLRAGGTFALLRPCWEGSARVLPRLPGTPSPTQSHLVHFHLSISQCLSSPTELAAALAPWPPTGPTLDRGIGKCCTQSSNMEIAEWILKYLFKHWHLIISVLFGIAVVYGVLPWCQSTA